MKIAVKIKPGESLADALKRVLKGREASDNVLNLVRRETYNEAIYSLRKDAAAANESAKTVAPPAVNYDRYDLSLAPRVVMADAAKALHLMEQALDTNNDDLLIAASIMFNMAAVELNEFMKSAKSADNLYLTIETPNLLEKLLDADDSGAIAEMVSGGFDRIQWPDNLWASLTDVERSVCSNKGLNPDNFVSAEELPYCPLQPCPGCDLRKKVLDFRALIEADQRGEVPPGARVY